MAFDYDAPAEGSQLASEPVRANFQALALHHRSTQAPSGPRTGYIWWDASEAQNEKLKARFGDTWVTLFEHMESTPVPAAGAASAFTALTDTPSAYTGQGGKVVSVKDDVSGLEFTVPAAGVSEFTALTDTPAAYTGQGGKVVSVKGDASGLEFTTPGGGGGGVSGFSMYDVTWTDTGLVDQWVTLPIGAPAGKILVGFYYWAQEADGSPLDPAGTYESTPDLMSTAPAFPAGLATQPTIRLAAFSQSPLVFPFREALAQGGTELKTTYPLATPPSPIVIQEGSDVEFAYVLSSAQDPTHPDWKLILTSGILNPGGFSASAIYQPVRWSQFIGASPIQVDDDGNLYLYRRQLYGNTLCRWHWRFFGIGE